MTRHHEAGVTLLELLVYVAIVGSLLTAVIIFAGTATDSQVKNQSIVEVNQQANAAIEYVTQTIRGASSVTLPLATTSGPQLTLVTPVAANNPTTLTVVNGVLTLTQGVAAPIALTGPKITVSNFTVTNVTRTGTSGLVRLSMTVARTNSSGLNSFDYAQPFQTTMGLRP